MKGYSTQRRQMHFNDCVDFVYHILVQKWMGMAEVGFSERKIRQTCVHIDVNV